MSRDGGSNPPASSFSRKSLGGNDLRRAKKVEIFYKKSAKINRYSIMVEKYKDCLSIRNYKPDSIRRVLQHVFRFLNWTEKEDITEIKFTDIEDYLITLANNGLKEKTLKNYLSSLSGFFNYLVSHGIIETNPTQALHKIQIPDTIPVYLPDNEVKLLLFLAKQEKIHIEVITALNTGLRMNELRHLKWSDVDLDKKQITVRGEIAKGKRPRTVPLNKKAMKVLNMQFELYKKFDYVFPGGQGGSNSRCVWDKNKKRSYNWWLRYSLDPIREQIPTIASLPKGNTCRGWHILRHTFATRLAKNGVELIKIKNWMGHRSINTTMRYIHFQDQYDKDIELI
jgi:integrase